MMVLVLDRRDPIPEDWSTWVETYSAAGVEHGVRRLLVVSSGGGPNARQRKELVTRVVARLGHVAEEYTTAVCGNSPIVRSITAAIGWLSGAHGMRSFADERRDEALAFLKVPALLRPEILATVKRFEAELRARER